MGFFDLFTSDLAIDLGTANTLILHKGKIVVDEPSIIAIDKNTDKVLFADFDSISSINQLKIIKEQRKQNIEKLFSQWDGSHIELTKKIKESLNDPKSYEHIETTYRDMGSSFTIYTTFTAKNGFGGKLKRQVAVVSDMKGNITEVIKWID